MEDEASENGSGDDGRRIDVAKTHGKFPWDGVAAVDETHTRLRPRTDVVVHEIDAFLGEEVEGKGELGAIGQDHPESSHAGLPSLAELEPRVLDVAKASSWEGELDEEGSHGCPVVEGGTVRIREEFGQDAAAISRLLPATSQRENARVCNHRT